MGGALLGLDILVIKEVYRHMTLTPVPGAPEHIGGLMNLRGRVVTVIDLEVTLDLPKRSGGEKRLLILKTDPEIVQYQSRGMLENAVLGEDIIGLLIDRMEEVLTIGEDDILSTPPNLDIVEKKLIEGVVKLKNRLVILLDVTAILKLVMSTMENAAKGESAV